MTEAIKTVTLDGDQYEVHKGTGTYSDCRIHCDLYHKCEWVDIPDEYCSPCQSQDVYFKRPKQSNDKVNGYDKD
ncbi:hypothetical protein [Vibrio sp. ER1A]|uniref:hypothetical protein n=1 Tax=Vibrio sp. ER1A TaxID=1517681 RepID=UPI0004DD1333|nr:hypothetical protein [Vibrio sp. ER1A]KFA99455.1 hypothetical protein HW45_03585 [Vibrio sp. ER1A]